MLLPSPTQALDVTRADFLEKEFRRFVAQKGLYVSWEQTIACPCHIKSGDAGLDLTQVLDVNDNISFNPSCVACSGKGVIRHSKQTIQAIVTNAQGEYKTEGYGTNRVATVKLSLLPEHLPSFGDKFTLINSHIVQQEIIERAAVGNTDSTKHPIATRTLNLQSGATPLSVLALYITNADGTTSNTTPTLDTDYQILDDGNGNLVIDWSLGIGLGAAGKFPLAGEAYSIAYYSNPVYIITSDPHTLRDTNLRINAQEVPTSLLIQAEARLEML